MDDNSYGLLFTICQGGGCGRGGGNMKCYRETKTLLSYKLIGFINKVK